MKQVSMTLCNNVSTEMGMKECGWQGQCYCKGGLGYVNSRTCETCPEGEVLDNKISLIYLFTTNYPFNS